MSYWRGEVDYVAVAPYMGPRNVPDLENASDQDILDYFYSLETTYRANIQGHINAIGSARKLITYEGGMGAEHTLLSSAENDRVLAWLQSDSARIAYDWYVRLLSDCGVKLFVQYTLHSPWSDPRFWGLINGIGNTENSPPYQAVLPYLENGAPGI